MTKAYHTLVIGDSGSGKTTLLRQIQSNFEYASIFVNHSGETDVEGVRARSLGELAGVVSKSDDLRTVKVNFSPTTSAREAARIARGCARKLREATGAPVQIVLDEADTVLPDDESVSGPEAGNPVRDGLHNDRDEKIKWVLATQDPQDLYYPPIKQCRNIIWVGVPSPFHKGFANFFRLSAAKMPRKRFEYVVFQKKKPFEWTEVHRATTDAAFSATI